MTELTSKMFGGRVGSGFKRRSRLSGHVRALISAMLSLMALMAAWQLIAANQAPYVFPGLGKVFESLMRFVEEGDLLPATWITLQAVVMGSLVALIIGTLAGFALHRAEAFTSPIVNFVQTVPYIVWALMSMIWFGLTQLSVVFTIFIAAFPIITFNVAAGLKHVDPNLIAMASSVRANRLMVLRHITLPSLTPYLLSSARSMLGMSWKISVLAELFAGGGGVGNRLFQAWEFSRTADIFAWTVWLVTLMIVSEWLILRPVELLVSRWKSA